MSIQMIPLNKLRLSPHNVRKSGADDNLDELVANIEAKGVLQNLIGGAAKKKGFFDIFAGGRRLRALNRLADAGTLANDVGVPVMVYELNKAGVLRFRKIGSATIVAYEDLQMLVDCGAPDTKAIDVPSAPPVAAVEQNLSTPAPSTDVVLRPRKSARDNPRQGSLFDVLHD